MKRRLVEVLAILAIAIVPAASSLTLPGSPQALAADLQRPAEQASDCSNPSTFVSAIAISLSSYIIFNFSSSCVVDVGVASFIIPSGNPLDFNIPSQIFFASTAATLSPGFTILTVDLPNCAFQTDAYWGSVPPGVTNPNDAQRVIGFTRGGFGGCTPTPTATATPSPTASTSPTVTGPNTATVQPSATPSPSRTSTITPTNTPTTTPTLTPPSLTATPVTVTGLEKSPDRLGPPPNSTVTFTVTFGLSAPAPQVRIVDIFSSTDTSLPHPYGFVSGSGKLDGVPLLSDPSCNISIPSQMTCNFDFANVSAGTHTLSYVWQFGAIKCFASGHNQVHIQLPPSTVNWRTDAISYIVRC